MEGGHLENSYKKQQKIDCRKFSLKYFDIIEIVPKISRLDCLFLKKSLTILQNFFNSSLNKNLY